MSNDNTQQQFTESSSEARDSLVERREESAQPASITEHAVAYASLRDDVASAKAAIDKCVHQYSQLKVMMDNSDRDKAATLAECRRDIQALNATVSEYVRESQALVDKFTRDNQALAAKMAEMDRKIQALTTRADAMDVEVAVGRELHKKNRANIFNVTNKNGKLAQHIKRQCRGYDDHFTGLVDRVEATGVEFGIRLDELAEKIDQMSDDLKREFTD